ncbi:MAG: cobalamin-dependent protein [Ruminiclostridium sp.]|nr:cobalamin-dependent protein [Ruminiclostridium sp.]
MKFLLLNSPIYWESTAEDEEYLAPIGLGYIATHLHESGVDVEVIDCVKLRLGVKDIIKLIEEKSPEHIGINIFTQNYEIVKYILENCYKSSTLFLGGQVVKSIYKDVLEWEIRNKMVLIIGEGELILPAIITNTCKDKPFYANSNKTVYVVNQDSAYFPADLACIRLNRKFLQDEIITNHYSLTEASIITSRGCLYDCAFCGGARGLNRDITTRIRESQDIVAEIQEIRMMYPDVNCIRVLDDLFLRNRTSIINAIDIFNRFQNLFWRGMAHVLSVIKSLDMLDALKNSGFKEIFIGIESGSGRIRTKINKAGTVEQVISVVEAILNAGIDVKGYFIYGFPSESAEDFDMTYSLAAELKNISNNAQGNFRCSVFQFRPYHGTKLYAEILESGRIMDTVKANEAINQLPRRTQFSFQSGNYSQADNEMLNRYILKTQKLSEGNFA